MSFKDLSNLILLAALWGAAFLFLVLAIHDFTPLPLIEVRVAASALFLLALSALTGKLGPLRAHWKPIFFCGVINSAIPFLCFAYAAQSLTAGTMSIINAMAPLFGSLVARFWLGEQLSRLRVLGLVVGFGGIVVLVSDGLSFESGGRGWMVLVAMTASLFYGIAACYIARRLSNVDPVACATGSMISSSILLLPFALATWPAAAISADAWLAAIALGVLCTGIGYIIFYRLIASVGSSRAITATFLVPPFGIFWGIVFLDEVLTAQIVAGGLIVVAGTLMATGFAENWLARRRRHA